MIILADSLDRNTILHAIQEGGGLDGYVGKAISDIDEDPDQVFLRSKRVIHRLDDVDNVSTQELQRRLEWAVHPRQAALNALRIHFKQLLAMTGFVDADIPDHTLPVIALQSLETAKREAAILEKLRIEPPMSSTEIETTFELFYRIANVLFRTAEIIDNQEEPYILQ